MLRQTEFAFCVNDDACTIADIPNSENLGLDSGSSAPRREGSDEGANPPPGSRSERVAKSAIGGPYKSFPESVFSRRFPGRHFPVYLAIRNQANWSTNKLHLNQRHAARRLGLSKQGENAAIRALTKAGFISHRDKAGADDGRHHGNIHVYAAPLPQGQKVVWIPSSEVYQTLRRCERKISLENEAEDKRLTPSQLWMHTCLRWKADEHGFFFIQQRELAKSLGRSVSWVQSSSPRFAKKGAFEALTWEPSTKGPRAAAMASAGSITSLLSGSGCLTG